MQGWVAQFAQWRAELGRQLNENPVWREIVRAASIACAPVFAISRATLRAFPGLKKLEWLLEIESLSRRHPVVLALSLAFVVWRGLMITDLGHIGTDKLIYPMLGAVSGFNPFLGMLCGVGYGVGDLIQKFWWPDMYGAGGWRDPNYWGAMVGYVFAYSSIMMMGLLPGMASRACRVAAVNVVKNMMAKRATRLADGAVPLGAPISPMAEMAAAAVGGIAAGWTVMHQVAPVTEMPAFLWRPNPDISCHRLEVNTHLKGYAKVGGFGAAAGGAAGVVLTPPPVAPEPPPPQQPVIPDEFEWTAPNGVTYVVKKNEQGQYINILTGGLVDVTKLDQWKQSWSNIIQDHQQWSAEQQKKLETRDTWFDKEMDKLVAAQKERDKAWQNLSQMQKNILFGNGPESHLYKPPGEPGNILDHIKNLQTQILQGRPLDKQKYDKIFQVYKDQKQGKIIQPSQMPTQSEIDNEIIRNTVTNTVKEFVTGTKADGSISWLGAGGRALTGMLTGFASEAVLVPANAFNTMKNYVDNGGNSVLGGFTKAMGTVIQDVAIGKIVGAGAGAVGKVLGAVGNVGAEVIKTAAKQGSSAAKALVSAAQSAASAAKSIGNVLLTPIGKKAPSLSTVVKVPKVATPSQATIIRNTARAGSTGITTMPSGISVHSVTTGFSSKAVKHIKATSHKYGVIIDARPTSKYADGLISTGQASPKAAFIKTKTLGPGDRLLGAKGPLGAAPFYKPKLPPQGSMSDKEYAAIKKLYDTRMKEFKDEFKALKQLRDEGKIYVKDGVIRQGRPLTPMDQMLGAKGNIGQVGTYKPTLPPKGNMSDAAYEKLKALHAQRSKEFEKALEAAKKKPGSGPAVHPDGQVVQTHPPGGKMYAGDIDIFDIRDPVTGKSIPRYQVDHKGNILLDAQGNPKLNPVREAILKDLQNGPCQAQHGAHMDWKYDGARPAPGTPGAEAAAEKFAHDQKIDNGVLDKHRPGPDGEPLISFGPAGNAEAVFITGGR
jgi:hypothetical protein